MNRKWSFALMLGVVGVSIVFGMILGGRLNAPRVMLAASPVAVDHPLKLAPAVTTGAGVADFADIVEASIPAVVQIVSTSVKKGASMEEDPHEMFRDDPFFRFFFGPPDERQRRQGQGERKAQSGGSGFIVSSDGYILTNNHVVQDAVKVEVTLNDGDRYTANVVGTDPNIDLALLKIDAKNGTLPTLPLGDSDKLRVGQWVIAIGNPFELSETVTVGVVSAKDRSVPIGDSDTSLASFLQTDAAINFGNSGGPLLDAEGRVVGINTAINRAAMAEGIGFALPINMAKSAMEQLRTSGKVRRGYIGITMTDINEAARDYNRLPDRNGVYVQTVVAKSPADQAGLKPGDIIRKADGDTVRNGRDLLNHVATRKPGDKVRLEVLRGGRTITADMTLAVRPDAQELARSGQGKGDSENEGEQGGETGASEGVGLRVEGLTPAIRERLQVDASVTGVVVTDVDPGSEAAAAGVLPGTIISALNDEPITSVSAWRSAAKRLKPGTAAKLKVYRGNGPQVLFMRVPPEGKD